MDDGNHLLSNGDVEGPIHYELKDEKDEFDNLIVNCKRKPCYRNL